MKQSLSGETREAGTEPDSGVLALPFPKLQSSSDKN